MFDLGTLKLAVKADTGEAVSQLNGFKGETKALSSNAQNFLNTSKENIKKISLAGVTAIGVLTGVGVKYNSEMENYRTNFGTMLGSEEAAVKKVNELKKMAEATPFGMSDLADATQTLLSFQVPAEQTQNTLKMLGDVSMGNKEKLKGLATVFGQVSSAGKLQGQDLMQLINQGFNPLNYISKRTGETMEQLRDRMAKGAISADEVTQAFQDATSKGGQFYDGMERGSKTTSGMISTLKDNVTSKIGELTSNISEKLKDLLPKVIEFVEKIDIDKVTNGIQKAIDVLTWIAPPLLTVIGIIKIWKTVTAAMEIAQLALNIVMNANPIMLIVTAVGALIAILVTCYVKCEGFRNFVNGFFKGVKDVFLKVVNFFKNDWKELLLLLVNPFAGAFALLYKHNEKFRDKVNELKDKVCSIFTNMKDKVKDIFDKIKNAITHPIETAKDIIKGIVDKIKGFFNINVSLPKIKLPHFAITPKGWEFGDLLKGKIPKLGIDWYANGGIMTQPTVFGYGNGNFKVGGEAGTEAVIPLNKLPELMAKMGYIKPSAINTSINIDGREFAIATSPYISEELAFV